MAFRQRYLLSGDEAVAHAARDAGVALGTGYPGTPSTEILEEFARLGGRAQWAPNEKVALEVAVGAAFGNARVLCTMKHVGLNVAADALFTAAYTGVDGPLVLVVCDDPGMASSQNEQDTRRYAVAAAVPMLEPSDSQEAYDLTRAAFELSARHQLPVILRMTTRVCHSKTVVTLGGEAEPEAATWFEHKRSNRVMVPGNARGAHRRLRAKLAELAAWAETSDLAVVHPGGDQLGIVTSGISVQHAREAAPEAAILQLKLTYPLPVAAISRFAATVDRLVVVEEGDPYLTDALLAAGIAVEPRPELYRFGELSVERMRRLLAGDTSPEPAPPRGKAPQLCEGCPHRRTFTALRDLDAIVAGDIGCYSLGVLPPFEAMDSLVCMGAGIGVGLGLRHVLPEDQARRVVSVIGDSTFIHSGITGLVEMAYNRPATGHVVLILDNATTAMTGLQEHPGTGRALDHHPTHQVSLEALAEAIGIDHVAVVDPTDRNLDLAGLLRERLASDELSVLVVRRPCLLAAKQLRAYERAEQEGCEAHAH